VRKDRISLISRACCLYSLSTAHIDGISEDIEVPEVGAYLKREYVLDSEQGDILILKRKGI